MINFLIRGACIGIVRKELTKRVLAPVVLRPHLIIVRTTDLNTRNKLQFCEQNLERTLPYSDTLKFQVVNVLLCLKAVGEFISAIFCNPIWSLIIYAHYLLMCDYGRLLRVQKDRNIEILVVSLLLLQKWCNYLLCGRSFICVAKMIYGILYFAVISVRNEKLNVS